MRTKNAEKKNQEADVTEYAYRPTEDFDFIMDEIVELILKS